MQTSLFGFQFYEDSNREIIFWQHLAPDDIIESGKLVTFAIDFVEVA